MGEAILAFGQEGRDALEGFIAQKDDRRLAARLDTWIRAERRRLVSLLGS